MDEFNHMQVSLEITQPNEFNLSNIYNLLGSNTDLDENT